MHLKSGKLGLSAVLIAGAMMFAPLSAQAQDGGLDFGDEGSTENSGSAEESGGGLDFGSEGGAATPAAPAVIDTSSGAYANYTQAQAMIESGNYIQAAQLLNDTIAAGDTASVGMSAQLHYELGRALYEAKFYQSALNHFDMVVSQGPSSKEFDLSLNYLVLIGRVLPGEPRRYARIYENYLDKFPAEVPAALTSEVGYLLAMAAYRESKLDDVVFFVGSVAQDSPLYPKSRYLEGVTYVRQNKGQPALDSFKEVLRWLDTKSTSAEGLTKDEARLREYTYAALARVFYQVGSTLWKMGEREKAANSWSTSIKYYNAFSRDSRMWLDALFEASWAYYRVDNFGKALGLLLTLNSPYFSDKYYPEARLLQATIYYTNCHYDRVVDILSDYKATYDPMKKQVDTLVSRLFQPEEVYDFLHMVQSADRESYDPTLQLILEASVQDRELRRGLAYIDMLDDEKATIQKDPTLSGSSLGQTMIQELEAARMLSVVEAGKKGKSRLERLQEELRDLSNRALDIEIETTEKYDARVELMEQDPNALLEFERQIDEVMGADDEHLFWKFDGEYWKDELGYYWYYISSRCGR
ncbi:MAG: tetratricopeptide repeat protein [Proteobacteria bacterium]|nr:tetratricopeptide repeat protein [Pseudomonadota bacterium]